MAKKPVGYKSPFKKASPMKIAPWLLAAGKWAATPQGMTTIGTALPGIIKGIGSLFGGRKSPALFGVEFDLGTSTGQRNFTIENSNKKI